MSSLQVTKEIHFSLFQRLGSPQSLYRKKIAWWTNNMLCLTVSSSCVMWLTMGEEFSRTFYKENNPGGENFGPHKLLNIMRMRLRFQPMRFWGHKHSDYSSCRRSPPNQLSTCSHQSPGPPFSVLIMILPVGTSDIPLLATSQPRVRLCQWRKVQALWRRHRLLFPPPVLSLLAFLLTGHHEGHEMVLILKDTEYEYEKVSPWATF